MTGAPPARSVPGVKALRTLRASPCGPLGAGLRPPASVHGDAAVPRLALARAARRLLGEDLDHRRALDCIGCLGLR